MKKKLVFVAMALLLLCVVSLAACVDPALKEVEGTYEMTDICGTISGVDVTPDMYEYFRIILDGKGNGKVQSKGKGIGAATYEAEGTYTYKDGKIEFTTKNSAIKATETYDYADGVITYTVNQGEINFTVTFKRVENEQK